MMENPDVSRLTRNLAGDVDRHFDDLVLAFQQPLFAFAYRTCGCRQDAEDVVQDVLIRAYRALVGYGPDRIRSMALRAWLFRICVNQLRNRRRVRRQATSELPDEIGPPGDPVGDGYEARESDREMQALLSRLPESHRSPVVLRFVNELSYSEIAQALGQPEGTVKSSVHRGLKTLRTYMEDATDNRPTVVAGSGRTRTFAQGDAS